MGQLIHGIPLYDIVGLLVILAAIALWLMWRAGREPEYRRRTTSAGNPTRKRGWS